MRLFAWFSLIALVAVAVTGLAEGSENAKLAIHVIASSDSLACDDLIPADCDSINVDLSSKEVSDADGYGYVVFLAFDADSLSGAEFAVDGWPTGRGAPPKQGPYWCADNPLSLGNIFGDGGITAFGECVDPGVDGLVPLGYIFFGPLDEDDFPIDLSYEASTYSYPDSGHNYVLGCAPEFIEYGVGSHSGCTIGGTYADSLPDCPETEGGGGDGPEGGEEDSEIEPSLVAEPLRLYADLATGDSTVLHFQLWNTADVAASYSLSASEDWITLLEANGLLSSGGETDIPVVIHAPVFPSGRYKGEVIVEEQDELGGELRVPVMMSTFRKRVWGYCGTVPNEYVEGQILFKVRPGVTDDDVLPVVSELDGVMIRGIDILGWAAAEVPHWLDQDAVMDALRSSQLVQTVERNWAVYPRWTGAPNDTMYDRQWSLNYPDTMVIQGCTPGSDIDMPGAWEITHGSPHILIGIVDGGIAMKDGELCHPDLDDPLRILIGWNNSFSGDSTDVPDRHGHGTHVTGIAAATADNEAGIAGVCPECKVIVFKTFTGDSCSYLRATDAFDSTVAAGADVINFSAGTYCTEWMQRWEDVIAHAADSNCIVVNAISNDSSYYWNAFPEILAICGTNESNECGYSNMIPVAATDCTDRLSGFSGWGPMVGVVAPGGTSPFGSPYGRDDIVSDWRHRPPRADCCSSYVRSNGCSFAAPHVTGLVGLIRSRRPELSAAAVRRIIFCTADQVDSGNHPYDEGSVCWDWDQQSGEIVDTLMCWGSERYRNEYYGYGRINAQRALELADTLTDWHTPVEGEPLLETVRTASIELSQNRPNPFNPTTGIHFYLPLDGNVDLCVYNVLGQRIRTLIDGKKKRGYHSLM